MHELPEGTVTLLFTDIEGSTRLLHELGTDYADGLAEHRRLLREAFARHEGVEVDTQGDAFFVAFARASDAVAAAMDSHAALAGGPVRVRIGIHTGEPVVTDEGYVGIDVHHGARVMSAAHGGQVLLSEATAQLLDSSFELRDLGEHRLKDLTAPQRLYQVGAADFPPPRTLYRANLPIQSSPLVGRERELDEAGELLREGRLVTLTGPGGSGKTRLALQLAAEAVEDFPDGVFWVPLQALRDPAVVEPAIADALGADDGLLDHVADRTLLVLLDNFEQIVEAAPVVSGLLAGTPNAKVLITSREPLHVESERQYPVEPLPDDDAEVLFIERARAVAPAFQPAPAVHEVCRRLDGLPLAIELAAARTALLDPDELLSRLDQRLPLLASRSRDAPERQRTLRATIEWSYDLLEPAEQELFRRVAVFRGSFSVEAAEAIFGATLDVLESLVVKSLVRRLATGRLLLLDTIREYALDRLDDTAEADDMRRRHADFFLSLAWDANLDAGKLRAGGQRLDVALLEIDNFRAALAWAVRSGFVALGLEIATAAEQLWVVHDPHEGVRWFERLLEHPQAADGVPEGLRGEALRAYGSSLHVAGRPDLAAQVWPQSLEIFERLDDEHNRAVMLHRLGLSAMMRGDLELARQLVETSDEIHRRRGNTPGLAQTSGALGAIARDSGDEARALELVGESVALAREVEFLWWECGALAELAWLSLDAGLLDEGEAHARHSLAIADRLRDRPARIFAVGVLARVAAERRDSQRAGLLWAVVENEHYGAPLGGWQRHRAAAEERIRGAAGTEFDRGYAEGRELPLDDAVTIALDRRA